MFLPKQNLVFWTLLLVFILNLKKVNAAKILQQQFAWKYLDYAFNSSESRLNARMNREYIPENNLPVGIEIWKNKLFVSVPRWRPGIPSTLNYINLDEVRSKSPLLTPYPDWESNELGKCKTGLSTVYRIKADECNRLWVLDTGTFGIESTKKNLCPYAINVFDLETNKRIRRFEIPNELIKEDTFIANIAVDVGKSCEDTFAYMSDELAYGLISYSWEKNAAWRFRHGFFFPDPLNGNFTIDGLSFNWDEEGIFGLSLTPRYGNEERFLYFSALASDREFAVSTNVLRNSSKVGNSYNDFVAIGTRGPKSHTTAQVFAQNGVQLFNLIDRNGIGCWNFYLPHKPEYIPLIDKDDTGLIFPADIKIDENNNVWVISDQMSSFLIASLDFKKDNFFIFAAPLQKLIKNTYCDVPLPWQHKVYENVPEYIYYK